MLTSYKDCSRNRLSLIPSNSLSVTKLASADSRRPVVLFNNMNQLVAYVVNERLTELVEHGGILTQA